MNIRLDHALVEQGLCETRARAQNVIGQGHVLVNGIPARKSSQKVSATDVIALSGEQHPWVSRGGMKLAHALEHFNIDVRGKVALDVGASTGGFTDVLLQKGTAKVYAVDVGRDQLHAKLRADARVVNMQGVNARELEPEDFEEPIDLVVCDASFISAQLVLESPLRIAATQDRGQQAEPLVGEAVRPIAQASRPKQGRNIILITLIKPQFQVGKDALPRDGVVKDEAEQERVCNEVSMWVRAQGWSVQGITDSPIMGPKGNKEFLLFASL